MTREERALLMMAEQSTHTLGSGATISGRRDQEVGLYKIKNCPRNRERYTLRSAGMTGRGCTGLTQVH